MKSPNGIDVLLSLEELVDPQHTALLIYDMQVGIVPQLADGVAVRDRIADLLALTRSRDIRTIFTRHMSLPTALLGAFGYRMGMAWQRSGSPAEVTAPFLRDSPAFHLVPELQPLPSEVVFDKLAMSAFEGTPLQFTLRDCGIRSLLICGIALEIGIEPTCRQAADLGIIPILVQDACGSGDTHAGQQCVEILAHMGDTILTDIASLSGLLSRLPERTAPSLSTLSQKR